LKRIELMMLETVMRLHWLNLCLYFLSGSKFGKVKEMQMF